MNFQVPQNLDIKDQVILGLGFKQLLYLGGGIGFLVFLFLFGNFILVILFGVPVMLLASLLSFYTVNNQSFAVILRATIRFLTRKKMYLWKQDKADRYVERSIKKNEPEEEVKEAGAKYKKVKDLNTDLFFDDNPQSDNLEVKI